MFFFFFQAEDGIRDVAVTGVQTCALPISIQAIAARQLQALVRPRPHVRSDDKVKIQSTPTDTVQAGFGALSDRNWLGLAASVHPAALTRFRQSELTFQLAWAYWKEGIAASKHKWAVAEDGSISPEGLGPVAHVTVSAYPDTPTVAQLATLSAPAFFATWCRAVYQSDSDRAQSKIGRAHV